MPHSQSVCLWFLHLEFSMSAQVLEKVEVEVYEIKKKLTHRYRTRCWFDLNSD